MTWTRLSDDFTDRPEMLEVTRSARLLHIEAMIWCNRMLTNGKLPAAALRRITDAEDISSEVNQLAKVGLWMGVEGDPDSWQLDWSDQESADDVRERQRYQAEKQKRYRDRKQRHERGDHSACDPRFCKGAVTGNATSNGDGHVTGRVTPSRPVPSRPLGRDREQGARIGSAGATPSGATEEADVLCLRVENFNAHNFRPYGDGTLCSFQGPGGDICDEPISRYEHGHAYKRESDEEPECALCDNPAGHFIHSLRDEEPQ